MAEEGALALGVPADLGGGRRLGGREVEAALEDRLNLATAETLIAVQIRQYAKRQRTFFRHRLPELTPLASTGEDAAPLAELTQRIGAALGRR